MTDGPGLAPAVDGGAVPTEIRYGNKTLGPLFADISLDRMRKRLAKFTSFRTRYYRSSTGRDSQQWLLAEIKRVAAGGSSISVSEFEHSWGQNTIVARIEPHGLTRNDTGAVIIGAHQDSTNLLPFLPAPGADDDGSGTVTILEAFTILAARAWQPLQRPVEFHWCDCVLLADCSRRAS